MKIAGLKALAAGVLALAALPASAQTIVAEAGQIAAVLKDKGYKAELKVDSAGDPYISSGSGGYSFAIFFYGCEGGANCKTVQLFAAFDTARRPDLEKMNEYARTKRWGRVYVDTSDDPAIEMDVDLEDGGMSRELFVDNLEYWDSVMQAFGEWSFDQFGRKK